MIRHLPTETCTDLCLAERHPQVSFSISPQQCLNPTSWAFFARSVTPSWISICLVVEGPINTHPAYYESKDPFAEADRKPDVALLKVNKFINHEATKILYSKNVWRLTWPGGDPQNFPENDQRQTGPDLGHSFTAHPPRNHKLRCP